MSKFFRGRSVHRNIDLVDIVRYRLPAAGLVSILHRASGALIFLLMPVFIWVFAASVSSAVSFGRLTAVFTAGLGLMPGWGVKLLAWAVIGACLFHFIAGLRHMWMDLTHRVSMEQGRSSAVFTLLTSGSLWLLIGAKLLGVY